MIFIDPVTDRKNVLRFIKDYSESVGIEPHEIDARKIAGIIQGAVSDGDYETDKASPFKKIASFVAHFIAEKPISSLFRFEDFEDIENHQNAIVALEIAIFSLHGASLHRRDGVFCTLSKRIEISDHSYIDIVNAIADITPAYGKNLLAVLLEQMCYRRNPSCEY